MSQVQFNRTSSDSAVGTEIVLRDANDRRLVFRPQVVNSDRDITRPVEGDLVWQRKKNKDQWEAVTTITLSSLKSGEGVRLALNTDETFLLYHALTALYRFHATHGVPTTGTSVDASPGAAAAQVFAVADAIEQIGADHLDRFMRWMTQAADSKRVLDQLSRLDVQNLQQLNTLVGVTALKNALATWLGNEDNDDEKWWQGQLRSNMFVLSQLFSFPIILVEQEAYVGGQTLSRKQGNFLDYLVKNRLTENLALVEIKTPATRLLGQRYRPDIFSPSPDLAGAVQQVINNRENLLKEFYGLKVRSGEDIEAFSPPSLVIAGHTDELVDPTQKKSFELYRNGLRNVQVITYDEMFAKINILIVLLEGQTAGVPTPQTEQQADSQME